MGRNFFGAFMIIGLSLALNVGEASPQEPFFKGKTIRIMEAMRDQELRAEAKKARLEINPLDGAELERGINDIFGLDPELVNKLKDILK